MQGFDEATGAVEREGDHVHTHGTMRVFGVGVEVGGSSKAVRAVPSPQRPIPPLSRALLRCAPALRHTDERIAIEGNEVEFPAPAVPVAVNDPATRRFEQMCGDALTARAHGGVATGANRARHRAAAAGATVAGAGASSAGKSGRVQRATAAA